METFNFNELKAANLFASREQTRPYIAGVYIDAANIVATDGHRMIVFRGENTLNGFLIPYKFLDGIKQARGKYQCGISLEGDKLSLEYNGATYTCTINKGLTYPDWQRVNVVDSNIAPVERINFNADYMADFAKVNKTLGIKSANIKIEMTNDGKVRVTPLSKDAGWQSVLMLVRD
jgi:hypothetical protein